MSKFLPKFLSRFFRKFKITNKNIRTLVHAYVYNKSQLPSNLRNTLIGDWDVSNVTDMHDIFNGCENFNEPLNNWNVSNVTNMSGMFIGCKNFNQLLNDWNVSNVINMSFMFSGCTNFNQPLNDWNVSNVINMSSMFSGCPIEEQNKPRFNVPIPRPIVNAYQIHKESAKINYEKLNTFLSEKINKKLPSNINYPVYINETLSYIINSSNNTESTKKNLKNGLDRIMRERLNMVSYKNVSELLRNSIFYALEYVLKQSIEFQKAYIDAYINESITAYNGSNGMTCAGGAIERFVNSLVLACQTILSKNIENEDYKKIIAIIIKNPNILIPEYILDWYKLHKKNTKNAFKPGTSNETKKQNLKEYLLQIFPGENKLINSKIIEIANSIGYNNNDFMYGGKKI
jgi:surface protein